MHRIQSRSDVPNPQLKHASSVHLQCLNKPVVDVARDAQCCVHTRDSSCRGQTHRWMDRHCATIRASLACASRANVWAGGGSFAINLRNCKGRSLYERAENIGW